MGKRGRKKTEIVRDKKESTRASTNTRERERERRRKEIDMIEDRKTENERDR